MASPVFLLPELKGIKRQTLWMAVSLAIVLALCQDLVEAFFNQFPFYLSESLLFKTTWILFFPFVSLQWYILKNVKGVLSMPKKIVLTLLPFTMHLFLTPLVIWSISLLFYDHTYNFLRTLEYTVSEDLYKLVIGYALLPLLLKKDVPFLQLPSYESGDLHNMQTTIEKMIVSNGRTHVTISIQDIQYIAAAPPYIAIHLNDKNYLDAGTLKSIQEKLAKKDFIRIHKSTIVNVRQVKSYTSRSNGDYDVTMNNETILRLSRNFASDFKKAFKTGTQLTP